MPSRRAIRQQELDKILNQESADWENEYRSNTFHMFPEEQTKSMIHILHNESDPDYLRGNNHDRKKKLTKSKIKIKKTCKCK